MATYFNYKLLANVTTFKFGGYIVVQTSQGMPCRIQKPTGKKKSLPSSAALAVYFAPKTYKQFVCCNCRFPSSKSRYKTDLM